MHTHKATIIMDMDDTDGLDIVLSETDGRDKFGAIAQSLCRLAYGLSLLTKSSRAALFRRLMVAVVDARRSFRLITLVALRCALRLNPQRNTLKGRLEDCGQFALCCGMRNDVVAWLQQHGAMHGTYLPSAKAADWWCAVSLGFNLVAQRVRGGVLDALTVSTREVLLFVQMVHDLLGRPLADTSHEAVRQILVGVSGLVTNTQDLLKMMRAARARQAELEYRTYTRDLREAEVRDCFLQ